MKPLGFPAVFIYAFFQAIKMSTVFRLGEILYSIDNICYATRLSRRLRAPPPAWGLHHFRDSWAPSPPPTSTSVGRLSPFRYRSCFFDEETGLYYLSARYYDPAAGRFLSADAISVLDDTATQINGPDLYAYCGNNPVMRADPSGREWWNPATWDWNSILKGAGLVALGIAAITIAALTFPVGGIILIAAGAAFLSGALTVAFGLSDVLGGVSGYNLVEQTVFQGNEGAYSLAENITAGVAAVSMLVCGAYLDFNSSFVFRSTEATDISHGIVFNTATKTISYYDGSGFLAGSICIENFEESGHLIHYHTEPPHSEQIYSYFQFIEELIKRWISGNQ